MDSETRFRSLLETHGAAIYRLAAFRERNPSARADLQQEIALALWRSLGTFREESSERTWVLRIAHNVAVTHAIKAQSQKKRVAELKMESAVKPSHQKRTPESEAIDRAQLNVLEERIRTLDLISQQIVLLHLEGLSTQEIAETTGLSLTNVSTKLSRLRAALARRDSEES
ncbi:MAG: RNA polymerase sigma factor [Polyangiaceae bacterium]